MLQSPTIPKAVAFAVATEEMAAKTYGELAKKFADQEAICEAFTLLATDEVKHGLQFKDLLDRLPPESDDMPPAEERSFLGAMARSEFFASESGITALLEKIRTVDEALVHVLGFEKATLNFYRAIQDVLGHDETLDAIIDAEKSHIVRLMKYLLTDEKMKGLADSY